MYYDQRVLPRHQLFRQPRQSLERTLSLLAFELPEVLKGDPSGDGRRVNKHTK